MTGPRGLQIKLVRAARQTFERVSDYGETGRLDDKAVSAAKRTLSSRRSVSEQGVLSK